MHRIDIITVVGIVVLGISCQRYYYSAREWFLSRLDWFVTHLVAYSPTETGKMIIQVILANGKRRGRKPDAILTDAISLGGLKLLEPFSWTTNNPVGAKQTSWQEAKQRKAQFVSELLQSVKPSTHGPPTVPLISDISRYDTLRRCLAFREFHLIATAKNNALGLKRKQFFSRGDGKWPQMVYASLGMLDVVTLQLQLLIAYGVTELLPTESTNTNAAKGQMQMQSVNPRIRNVLDAIKTTEWGAVASHWGGDISWEALDVVKKGQKLRKKGWLLHFLNGWLFHQSVVVPDDAKKSDGWMLYLRKKTFISTWLLSLPHRVIKASIAAGKENMPGSISNLSIWKWPENIGKWIEKRRKNMESGIHTVLLSLPVPVQRWFYGISTIKVDPLAPALVRSAAYSAEALSSMLIAALAEDTSGFAPHHLIAILESLCALSIALMDYRDLLRRCHPLGCVYNQVYPSFLLNNRNDNHDTEEFHYVSSLQVQRARLQISVNLEQLETTVNGALTSLIRAFRDILESHLSSFIPLHATLLKEKLEAIR